MKEASITEMTVVDFPVKPISGIVINAHNYRAVAFLACLYPNSATPLFPALFASHAKLRLSASGSMPAIDHFKRTSKRGIQDRNHDQLDQPGYLIIQLESRFGIIATMPS